jgi:hypothetical protein
MVWRRVGRVVADEERERPLRHQGSRAKDILRDEAKLYIMK